MPEPHDEIADLLGRLTPAPPDIDRDALLHEAGRRSARSPWRVPAVGFAALSLVLGARLATLPTPAPIERIVYVVVPPVESPPSPPPPSSVAFDPPPRPAGALRLRDDVIRWGPDALPAALPCGAARPPSDDLLGLPADAFFKLQRTRPLS